MGRNADVTLDWADGTYRFRLAWAQLIELQEQCDAGPFVVLARLASNQWRMEDVTNVIRLGLIGGGLEPTKALKLVRDYVESRPPLENAPLARGVLEIAIRGVPDEQPGEVEGEATTSDSTTSPTESSE